MASDFDQFVSNIEQRVLPDCEALAAELRAVWPEFEYSTFSNRHADLVHALGLWCTAPDDDPLGESDSRGIIINLFGMTNLTARGFVNWRRWHVVGRLKYPVDEVATAVISPRTPHDLDELLNQLPLLQNALRLAFERGYPPDLNGKEWDDVSGSWRPIPKRRLLSRLLWWKA